MPKNKPAPLYNWGDGKGKIHTIPKDIHAQNVEARGYGINLDAPTSDPLSNRQVYGQAQQAADLEFNPQINAAKGMQRAVPEWYANYREDVARQQGALKAYSDPLLQQAQQGVTNAGAMTAPGLDPSSPQYATEQQAAQGRQSIAQLGYDTLAAIPTATQAYFGGQATTASKDQIGAQALYGQRVGELQGQRGAAVATNYGTLRGQEQNADIANQTLGLNTNKAAADVDLARGVDPVTGRKLPKETPTGYAHGGPGQNKYGYTYDEWNKLGEAGRKKEREHYGDSGKSDADKAAEKAAADAKKHQESVKTATGKLRSQVTDITDYQQELVGQQGEDKSKKPDINGNYPTRAITQKDIDRAKVAKYGTLGKIAIAIRDGRGLTQGQIDYLHQKDPNFRIPREWLKSRPQTDNQKAHPHDTAQAPERAPGGARGHV